MKQRLSRILYSERSYQLVRTLANPFNVRGKRFLGETLAAAAIAVGVAVGGLISKSTLGAQLGALAGISGLTVLVVLARILHKKLDAAREKRWQEDPVGEHLRRSLVDPALNSNLYRDFAN